MTTITAASFPTPDLARRGGDPAEVQRVAAFAQRQADAATALLDRLAGRWPTAGGITARIDVLRIAHAETLAWRHALALQAPRRLGQGLPHDASRFATTLRAGGPNSDRLGYLGRLRDGASWNPATRTYQGGASTPAHEVMLRYGQLAEERMDREAPGQDTLVNVIRLGHRRRVAGNRLVRGAAARRIAEQLVQRIVARGGDTSRIETGGNPMYVVTADPDAADLMFDHALVLLAVAGGGDVDEAPAPTAAVGTGARRPTSPRVGDVLSGPDADAGGRAAGPDLVRADAAVRGVLGGAHRALRQARRRAGGDGCDGGDHESPSSVFGRARRVWDGCRT